MAVNTSILILARHFVNRYAFMARVLSYPSPKVIFAETMGQFVLGAIMVLWSLTSDAAFSNSYGSEPLTGNSERQAVDDSDIVEIVSSQQGVQRLRGLIVDVSGEGLVLQLTDRSVRKISPDQVVGIETRYSSTFWDSQQAIEQGRIDEGIQLLFAARKEESRSWVRRDITARIVRLLHSRGQYAEAAREFLASDFAADARSPYWSCIPLTWFPEMSLSAAVQDATSWVISGRPEQQLLGASYLLDGSGQAQAVAVLEQLRLSPNRVVALVAAAQLWRREIQTADKTRIIAWEKALEDLPGPLRPGPSYVIASAWRAQGDLEKAILIYLKPPILWPESRRIAARCLWEAANLLEKGQSTTAGRSAGTTSPQWQADALYQELLKRFPESPWANQISKDK